MARSQLAAAIAQLAAAPEVRAGGAAWGRAARWARASAIILLVLLVGSAAYILVFSSNVVADAHRRNYHDLAVAANGLETWPADIRRLALSNFARHRITPATPTEQTEGWSHAADLGHPEIGQLRIRYAVRDLAATSCPAGDIDPATARPGDGPAFVQSTRPGAGPAFVVAGALAMDDIWAADRADGAPLAGTPATRAAAVLAATQSAPLTLPATATATAAPALAVCFRVVVELDRLIALDRTGQGFAHLLITDAAGNIFGQTGGERLAVRALTDLRPARLGVLDFGDGGAAAGKGLAIGGLHRPAEIDIGDETYTVYARPFTLPGRPPPCSADAAAAKAAPNASAPAGLAPGPAPAPAPAAAPPATCHAVALMPAATLRARWFAPPPLVVFGFAMVVLAALALFPALRLVLIGGTEAVAGLEITAVIAGLQMAASLAMLAILAAVQVSAERHAANDTGRLLVAKMSAAAGAEIAQVTAALATTLQQHPPTAIRRLLVGTSTATATGPANAPADAVIAPDVVRLRSRPGQVLPIVESLILVGWNGRQLPGSQLLVDRDNAAVRIDVGRRPYFLDLRGGTGLAPPAPGSPRLRYTVDVVRAQTDGIQKTVLAIDARALPLPQPAALPPGAAGPPARAPALDGAIIVPTLLRSFLAPVLPAPHRFLVIDRRNPGFPVLFHSDRERGGVEQFGALLGDRPDLRVRLAGLAPGTRDNAPNVLDFNLRYDGRRHHFAARGVPGTNWAVLVFHADDDIDTVVAEAGRQALYIWVAIGSLGVITLYAAVQIGTGDRPWYRVSSDSRISVGGAQRQARWRRFWPHEAAGPRYVELRRLAGYAALSMLVLIVVTGMAGAPGLGIVAILVVLVALLLRIGARLGAVETGDKPLSPATQRAFGRFVAMLLLCTAAVPSLAFWTDSLTLVSIERDARAFQASRAAIAERDRQTIAIQHIFDGIDSPRPRPRFEEGRGIFPPVVRIAAAARRDPILFSEALRTVQQGLPPAAIRTCTGATPGAVCGTTEPGIAQRSIPAILWGGLHWTPDLPLRLIATLLLAAGLVAGLVHFGRQIFRALFGFGVPLAAVTLPRLWIDKHDPDGPDDGHHLFGAKSLLVAPQQAVRERTLDRGRAQHLDLVDATAALGDGATGLPPVVWMSSKPRLAVTGLDLILRDPQRRRAALGILEALAARADAAATIAEALQAKAAALAASDPAGAARLRQSAERARRELVIISDRAPLDRILDAFEIEKQRAGNDDAEVQATRKAREELRWARLFQDFATFSFAPVDKIDDDAATRRLRDWPGFARWPTATQAGVATLVDELRWLPGSVINGATFRHVRLDPVEVDRRQFPLGVGCYRAAFTPAVADWACTVQPASPEAAVEYVWGTVIEYYQQCWSSSTYGERLVLDALANGRFVNFGTAVALKSLVRRGLVVLDPAPRLMNASFALFVRQAERPETLADWRSKQPGGGWSAARLPIVIGLAAMVVVLGVVVDASQSLGTLVPLLFAGAPALATTIATFMKRA